MYFLRVKIEYFPLIYKYNKKNYNKNYIKNFFTYV